ncbi:MAG TPA: hypothetical protein VHW03_01975 [Chthoniobacterales bacterium]|jgi:hypothetical protein|nr:hypothetical protein [Chthoniobacterales bacterium]
MKITDPENPSQLILTSEEARRGDELQKGYDALDKYRLSLGHSQLVEARRIATHQYQADPCDETFERLKRASLEMHVFDIESRAKSVCHEVLSNFTKKEVVPWERAIVVRLLTAADSALQKVREVENARTLKFTGQNLRSSDIVAAAQRPVDHLRAMLKEISKEECLHYANPETFLKAVEVIGGPNFDFLVDKLFLSSEQSPGGGEGIAAAESEKPLVMNIARSVTA